MELIHCSTCKLWLLKTELKGSCHKRAPTDKGFPVTYATDFCGEWLPKEKKDEKES